MKKEADVKLKELRQKYQAAKEKQGIREKEDDELIEKLNDEINTLLDVQAKRLAQRARVQWIEKGERNNKYFLNLIKHNQQKQEFKSIFNDEGNEIWEQGEIKKEIHKFYSELYSRQANDESNVDDHPMEVTDEENSGLTKPITMEELTKTLRESKGTTPGPDGIPNDVYKQIWDIAGQVVLDAWEHSLRIGHLSVSQSESVICLLDKKGKDRRYVGNLRPITLSNCDLKLITKTYTSRVNTILNRILVQNQTAYLPNRQVHDGLRLIDMYKDHFKDQEEAAYLISLDAKKAYDSVSHEYIKSTIIGYGFHKDFVKVFETLYCNISTRVLVNGSTTEPIAIGRGVKQGDALSCSLFILLMDTVIRKMNANRNIRKVMMNGSELTNTIAYADDLAVIATRGEDISHVFSTYEEFSKKSGLYLNADKTEILNLKRYEANEVIKIKVYNEEIELQTVKEVKICGKTYSMDPTTEHKENVAKQICKVEKQVKQWEKRNLTTEGRIIISKTFGISQVVYNMQSTFFEPKDIKEIEKIVYKFIWKGPDKIKRKIIQGGYADGGLKGPNIEALDKTLKLKQVLRASNL